MEKLKFKVKDHTLRKISEGYSFVVTGKCEIEDEWAETFGIKTVNQSFEGIVVDGYDITMGDGDIVKKIEYFSCFECDDLEGKLPSLYCVRQRDKTDVANGIKHARFVCGMDLLSNGMIWVGLEFSGFYFDTINRALQYLDSRLDGNFEIFIEEPMSQ